MLRLKLCGMTCSINPNDFYFSAWHILNKIKLKIKRREQCDNKYYKFYVSSIQGVYTAQADHTTHVLQKVLPILKVTKNNIMFHFCGKNPISQLHLFWFQQIKKKKKKLKQTANLIIFQFLRNEPCSCFLVKLKKKKKTDKLLQCYKYNNCHLNIYFVILHVSIITGNCC